MHHDPNGIVFSETAAWLKLNPYTQGLRLGLGLKMIVIHLVYVGLKNACRHHSYGSVTLWLVPVDASWQPQSDLLTHCCPSST